MSEVIPVEPADESQVSLDASTPESVTPATPTTDEITWKKRLAGKDQALTATQRERDELKNQLAEVARWKAEKEQADMTELQKAQARVAELESIATKAQAEAVAARLGRQYPLAAEILGDDLAKFDEVRVAEINGRLAKEQEAESEPESRIDANNPRGRVTKAPRTDLKSAKDALTDAGNPYFDESAWGSTNPR